MSDAEIPDDVLGEIDEAVKRWVALGYDTREEILEDVMDIAESEDLLVGESWAGDKIDAAVTAKLVLEADWDDVLDTDRLDEVAMALEERGILLVMDAGDTIADAMEIIRDILADEDEGPYTGWAYFHRQDAEAALGGAPLMLGFGSVEDDDELAVRIGREIEQQLTAAGLRADWDGTLGSRIRIAHFDPRRRGLSFDDDE